jgi:hypothetical protein
MKIHPVDVHTHNYLQVQTRRTEQFREDTKHDNRVKTIRADTVLAGQTLLYKKEFDVIWLIQHSRIGGSVDKTA